MRRQTIQPKNLAKGEVAWSHLVRRVTVYLSPDAFDLLTTMAADRCQGTGVVAAELLEDAILKKGPHS